MQRYRSNLTHKGTLNLVKFTHVMTYFRKHVKTICDSYRRFKGYWLNYNCNKLITFPRSFRCCEQVYKNEHTDNHMPFYSTMRTNTICKTGSAVIWKPVTLLRQCCTSGSWAMASHCQASGLIPGDLIWNLWVPLILSLLIMNPEEYDSLDRQNSTSSSIFKLWLCITITPPHP